MKSMNHVSVTVDLIPDVEPVECVVHKYLEGDVQVRDDWASRRQAFDLTRDTQMLCTRSSKSTLLIRDIQLPLHHMPRLSWRQLTRAYQEHPLLPLLLRPCRDISLARAELRWLRKHALSIVQSTSYRRRRVEGWRTILHRLCNDRAREKPLQYILGDQPFGDLEILCRPGVLIPRYAFLYCPSSICLHAY